jgi:hypothetical protein
VQDRIVIEHGQRRHGGHDTLGLSVNRRPKLSIVAPDASPQEAAAVVAALERFMRETVPPAAPLAPQSRWQQVALYEGVDRAVAYQPAPRP